MSLINDIDGDGGDDGEGDGGDDGDDGVGDVEGENEVDSYAQVPGPRPEDDSS